MTNSYHFCVLETGGTLYHGLSTDGSGPLCLHVHGTWGNFYENPFVFELTDTYANAGYVYASTNNPGHDGGSMREEFDASLPVLRDWINHLSVKPKGLILQGHSLGALKLMQMLTRIEYGKVIDNIRAIVLLSPFDLVAFYGGVSTLEIDKRRARAENIMRTKGKDELIDTETFDIWPISAGTFLSATLENGPWDIFPTRRSSTGKLAQIDAPLLVVLGGEDFAATPSADRVAQIIKDEIPKAHVSLIPGAPHNFAAHENELSQSITDFLNQLPA